MSCQHESHQRPVAPTSKPLPESLQWLEDDLVPSNPMISSDRSNTFRATSGTVILNDLELINFGSNDYLGYAGDSRLIKASAKELLRGCWCRSESTGKRSFCPSRSLGTNLSSLLNTEESHLSKWLCCKYVHNCVSYWSS